jgi:xanthine dehydrogenase small subunit
MDGRIRFILDGRLQEIDGVDPNMTVLEWLRGPAARRGTTEGGAEGDCGACTVVVTAPGSDGGLACQAVNACIRPLATLDGCELATVESLGGADGALHPVQQEMVACHGSQCGFCTPGFVMSLYAMERAGTAADDEATLRALAGNLCRCTGYRPILDAARRLAARREGAGTQDAGDLSRRSRIDGLARTNGLRYAGRGRHWYAPRNLAEFDAAHAEAPDATLIAGATDLGLEITKKHVRYDALIALGGIAELNGIVADGATLDLGAAVTWTQAHAAFAARWPDLDELVARFAGLQIRNVATLGGNLANASPIGDGAPMLLALDAELELWRAGRRRRLPLDRFFLGYRRTALEPGEIIMRIRVREPGPGTRVAAYKVSKRFESDISAVCACFAAELGADGRIASCRIAFGGMAAVPLRLPQVEEMATGRTWDEALDDEVVEALGEAMTPISDLRAGAAYRRRVAASLWLRFAAEQRDGASRRETRVHG